MTIFRRPHGAEAAGDAMPAFIDDELHLVAGCSPTGTYEYPERVRTSAFRTTTRDFVTWQEHGSMLDPGEPGTYDGSGIWTGSLIKHDGQYWHFYTAFSEHAENPQTLCVATGPTLDSLEKVEANPLVKPIAGFEPIDWRDPYVFFNEDEGCWWMVFSARLSEGPHWRRGCVMAATSSDLLNWEVIPTPIYTPGDTYCPECPELWKADGQWYLVYSRFSEDVGTIYRVGDSCRGPFRTPQDEYLGGRRWYAAKSAPMPDGSRVFFGWVHDKRTVGDRDRWLWGGDFTAARRVCPDETGALRVQLMPEVRASFSRILKQDQADISAVGTTESVALLDEVPERMFVDSEFSFDAADKPASFGLILAEDADEAGWRLAIDRRLNQLTLTREPRPLDDFWADLTDRSTTERDVDGQFAAVAVLPPDLGSRAALTVILEDEILEVYLNDQVTLSYRLHPRKAYALKAFASDGDVSINTVLRDGGF